MKIGLTYTGSEKKHLNYHQWLQAGEKDIEIIKLSETQGNREEIDKCDALVLSGGIDINPALYGGDTNYDNKPPKWNDARDNFEANVFRSALERKIPVLGICRGLQLINVLLNGTLIQDLDAGNKIHEGSPDKKHTVEIINDSLLHDITGLTSGTVNSAHHQAIGKLGEGLQINSKSAEGTIEGIEWLDKKDKSFLLGVQWHPERMFLFDLHNTPLAVKVRNQFINEIRNIKR